MRPATTPALRSFVESTFSCLVKVTRADGEATFDPLTGTYDEPARVTVYEGKALVYARDQDAKKVMIAESAFTVSKYVVVLPAGTPVKLDDMVTVTSSPDEARLTELTFTIIDVPLDVWGVAQHCVAEVVGGP